MRRSIQPSIHNLETDYKERRKGNRTREEVKNFHWPRLLLAPNAQLHSELVLEDKEPSRNSRPTSARQLRMLPTDAILLPPQSALSREPS